MHFYHVSRNSLIRDYRAIWLLPLIILLASVTIGGLVWVNYRFASQNPGGNDFLARWMGARYWLKQGISPYDERVSLASQEMIYGRPADPDQAEDLAHFVYPLTSMVFFAPFGLLDYLPARTLWMAILELSLAALAFVSVKLADWKVSPVKLTLLVLFSLLWYHGARTIIIGQIAGINALLIALALLLILRKQDTAAGFILALSTAKPQMVFLIIPFVLMWAISVRRNQIVISFVAAFGVLLLASLSAIPAWPFQMLHQIMEYPQYTFIGSPIAIISAAAPGIERFLAYGLSILVTGYLLFEWILAWGKDQRWFLWTALLTIVVTNLVAFRTATTNFVMMLPVVFFVFRLLEDRWNEIGLVATWTWLVILFIGLWVLFINTVEGNLEGAIMYLPLPIFCLFGLWWVRWWAINPPVLQLEKFIKWSR
jgi:hypothetical protein